MVSLVLSVPPNNTVHVLTPYEFTFITKGVVNLTCGQRTWKSNLRFDKAPFYQLGSKFPGLHKLDALGWAFTGTAHVTSVGRCQLSLPEHPDLDHATTTPSERK